MGHTPSGCSSTTRGDETWEGFNLGREVRDFSGLNPRKLVHRVPPSSNLRPKDEVDRACLTSTRV